MIHIEDTQTTNSQHPIIELGLILLDDNMLDKALANLYKKLDGGFNFYGQKIAYRVETKSFVLTNSTSLNSIAGVRIRGIKTAHNSNQSKEYPIKYHKINSNGKQIVVPYQDVFSILCEINFNDPVSLKDFIRDKYSNIVEDYTAAIIGYNISLKDFLNGSALITDIPITQLIRDYFENGSSYYLNMKAICNYILYNFPDLVNILEEMILNSRINEDNQAIMTNPFNSSEDLVVRNNRLYEKHILAPIMIQDKHFRKKLIDKMAGFAFDETDLKYKGTTVVGFKNKFVDKLLFDELPGNLDNGIKREHINRINKYAKNNVIIAGPELNEANDITGDNTNVIFSNRSRTDDSLFYGTFTREMISLVLTHSPSFVTPISKRSPGNFNLLKNVNNVAITIDAINNSKLDKKNYYRGFYLTDINMVLEYIFDTRFNFENIISEFDGMKITRDDFSQLEGALLNIQKGLHSVFGSSTKNIDAACKLLDKFTIVEGITKFDMIIV